MRKASREQLSCCRGTSHAETRRAYCGQSDAMQKGREWIGDGAGDQIAKKLGTKIRPGQLVSATVPYFLLALPYSAIMGSTHNCCTT